MNGLNERRPGDRDVMFLREIGGEEGFGGGGSVERVVEEGGVDGGQEGWGDG